MKAFAILSTLLFSTISLAAPTSESLEVLSTSSLPFGKNAISQFDLATSFPPPLITDASSIEAIRATLALYAFAIDGKNFDALSEVFVSNVQTNYSAPLGVLTPLTTVQSVLKQSLQCVTTHHTYGTQLITIKGLTSAFSVTYFTASHFGRNKLANEVATSYAQYQDTWQRQWNGKWKIIQRNFVFMGPLIGNPAVFADC